jgi:cell wall-associated NlpC family hydrolase
MPARLRVARVPRVAATFLLSGALAVTSLAVLAGSTGTAAASVGTTASSLAVAGSTPVTGRVSFWTSAATVKPDTVVGFGAEVTASNGARVPGATVTFVYYRHTATSDWVVMGVGVTDSTGIARLSYRLGSGIFLTRVFVKYQTTAVAGNATLAAGAVASGVARTTVVQPVSSAEALLNLKFARVLALAAALRGRPYEYAAAGPYAFDCSGYTQYVYSHAAGIYLPHNAAEQYTVSEKISRSAIRPGDLIFFYSSGGIYHVAIYAGSGLIWHAPYPGTTVRLERIWTSSWVAGRVI